MSESGYSSYRCSPRRKALPGRAFLVSSAALTTSAEPWEAVKVRHYINNKVVYPKAEFLDYLEFKITSTIKGREP